MIDESYIKRVDGFGEKLKDLLSRIGEGGKWGAKVTVSKLPGSDYWRSQVIAEGEPQKKNWVQINGRTYSHPSYSSPKPWKIQARFASPPGSPLWEKKLPYIRSRQPLEWSLGGLDVWAISYESLSKALSEQEERDIVNEILADLAASWAYANGRTQARDSVKVGEPHDRVQIPLSIDPAIWAEFQQSYARGYSSRRKHPKRPSYAKLRDDAIDEAFLDYVAKRNLRGGQ